MDYQTAINKIERYISYQERSEFEVKNKLSLLKVPFSNHQKIIDELKLSGMLSDERFAKAFVQGKFRFKNWGKIKLKHALRTKLVSNALIDKALKSISDEEYFEKMKHVYGLKRKEFKKKLSVTEKAKIARHMQSKGFELEFIMKLLQSEN